MWLASRMMLDSESWNLQSTMQFVKRQAGIWCRNLTFCMTCSMMLEFVRVTC